MADNASDPRDRVTEIDAQISSSGERQERVYLVCRLASTSRVLELAPGQELVVGRLPELPFCIDDPRVSRRHTRIVRTDAGLFAEDLGSRNGTIIAGARVVGDRRSLAAGDVLQIGPGEIVVAVASVSPAAPPPQEEPAIGDADDDMPPEIVVADPGMRRVFQTARRLAAAPTTVLLLGETGVGKEVVAEQIHRWSPRAGGPFVRVNCASVPEALIESEFFGHERGAFTGADQLKRGLVEAAHEGTLMLDEIGELPLGVQAKLLRVVDTRKVMRVGSVRETPVDVRLICATHRDLKQEVAAGRFRQDFFYRISTFTIEVPPLRQRPAEVLVLARLFARQLATSMRAPEPSFDPRTIAVLQQHAWPGNVRELRNAIEHAVVLAGAGPILPEHLPATLRRPADAVRGVSDAPADVRAKIASVERQAIADALAAENGNQTRAAERLGLTRRALIYRMQKHGLGR